MIMIKGAVGKKKYKEPFSKGIMARSLYITDLGYDKSYEIATCIENKLLEENISEISIEDLAEEIHTLTKDMPFRQLPLPYMVSKRVKFD